MKADESLVQRVALVTGAGSGIGEAVAHKLAEAGATVVVADLNSETAQHCASDIGSRATASAVDISDDHAVSLLVDDIVARFGTLDFAVNNAGIGQATGPVHEETLEDWHKTLSVNVSGTFYCMRHELRVMVERKRGAIVNMASVLGLTGFLNAAAYVASKHAVIGLTKAAALDYAHIPIRINAVCPGFIQTPLVTAQADAPRLASLAGLHPLARLGTVTEVAEMVLFLLSDRASFSTGANYLVDGGYSAL